MEVDAFSKHVILNNGIVMLLWSDLHLLDLFDDCFYVSIQNIVHKRSAACQLLDVQSSLDGISTIYS